MRMALRPACACSRYLSPTRLTNTVAHPRAVSHDTNGTTTSPLVEHRSRLHTANRWHSKQSTVAKAQWRSTVSPTLVRWRNGVQKRWSYSSSNTPHDSQYIDSAQSQDSATTEHKETADLAPPKELSQSLDNLTSTLRQWSQTKNKAIDIAAFTKLVSSLNIELPRKYERVIPTLLRVKQNESGLSREELLSRELAELQERQKKRRRLLKEEAEEQLKEQHDLAEAISSTQESIQTYFSSINLSAPKSDSEEEIKKPVKEKRPRLQDLAANRSIHSTITTMPASSAPTEANPAPSSVTLKERLTSLKQYLPTSGTAVKEKEDTPKTEEQKKAGFRREMVAKGSIDRRTRGLIVSLKHAPNNMSRLVRLEELCKHLYQYPDAKNLAVKEHILPYLLRMRKTNDLDLRAQTMEALALVGYANPVRGRGIRILSLDGGGTRGLLSLAMLREIENLTGKRIHELFDFVSGVSTGSLIAAMVASYRASLEECEYIYKEFSTDTFQQNKFIGTGKLFYSHAFYDSALWENILKDNLGERTFLETTRDKDCPKYAAVSTVMNKATTENYLFRNYTYPSGTYSHYPGSMKHAIWEAIRASSAAPGYFEEFKHSGLNHQDGGLLTNNPTAVAIHECRLLWPNEDIQCVVSMGTGRFRPSYDNDPDYSGLKNKLLKIVQSATDTEAVHTILNDLLPPSTYFRFNPYMSEDFQLDEIRPEKWDQMAQDVSMYCRKNEAKFNATKHCLLQERTPLQKASDWAKLQRDMMVG